MKLTSTILIALLTAGLIFSSACNRAANNESQAAHAKKTTQPTSEQVPTEFIAVLMNAELAIQAKNYQLASQNYLSLAYIYQDPQLAERAALLAFKANNVNLIVQATRYWANLAPENSFPQYLIASLLLQSNYPERAEPYLANIFMKNKDQATQLITKIDDNLSQPKYKQNLADNLTKLATKYPNNALIQYNAGAIAYRLGHYKKSQQFLKKCLQDPTQASPANFYLGTIAEKQRQFATAIKWYQGVTSPPYYLVARLQIADILMQQGKFNQAMAIVKTLSSTNPKQTKLIMLAKIQILMGANQLQHALTIVDQALKASPKDIDLLYARSNVLFELGKIDTAEQNLKLILRQQPKNANALNALGYMLADSTDRYQEALAYIKQALAISPNDPNILDSMGWVQYRLGNYRASIKYLKQSLTLEYTSDAAAHLGEVLWAMGAHQQAMKIWQEALTKTPNNKLLLMTIDKYKQQLKTGG